MTTAGGHVPVMLAEMLAVLAPRAGAVYVDATYGGGGYARALLDAAECRVWAVDRDPRAVVLAADLCRRYAGRLTVVHGRFAEIAGLLAEAGIDGVDGVAFDLGASSDQLDAPERGFSFRADGPLDMRMDPTCGPTAADVVNAYPQAKIENLLRRFGEERAARRIAAAIVRERAKAPILRTMQLAGIVHRVLPPARDRIDTATRTFQALRICVNDELAEIDRGLGGAEQVLRSGGRLCVVSFHSLEDRCVKSFLNLRSGKQPRPSRHRPEGIGGGRSAATFRLYGRGLLRPNPAEVKANPRARSARLRAAERTAAPPWPAASVAPASTGRTA
jgi:16S rRNA (cytosine1402-N4)-methyltransferase